MSAPRLSSSDARLVAPTSRERLRLPPADPREAAPLPFDAVLIAAGLNVAARSIWRGLRGWKRYDGSVEAICRGGHRGLLDRKVLRRFGGTLPAILDARPRDVHAGAVQPRLSRARDLVVGVGPRAVRARGTTEHDDLLRTLSARRLRLRLRFACRSRCSRCERRAATISSTGTASCSGARSRASTRSSSIPSWAWRARPATSPDRATA